MLRYLFIDVLVLISIALPGQVSKSLTSAKFNVPKVSRAQARILCPGSIKSAYPFEALGFKVGDPVAVTFKNYSSKRWAFAVDLGKASSRLYNRYYRNEFRNLVPDSVPGNPAFQYVGYRTVYDWMGEIKLLRQADASALSKGLQFYGGLGWQWRLTKIVYDYRIENNRYSVEEKRFPQGPVVCVGFEYSIFSLPISAFMEMEWVTDVSFDPGYSRVQGGAGLRFVF